MSETKPPPRSINPNALVIRRVTEADLPALEWDGEYQKNRLTYARLFEDSKAGNTIMWMVETPRGEMVGQAFVMLVSGEKDAADGKERAYIFAFRVKRRFRNQGVGTMLMRFIERTLTRQGFKTVTLNVAKENPDARRLYERLGYRVTGSRPGKWSFRDDKGKIQRVNEPAWRMEKRIGD
ncbi:GNAT family N-acetyltransferase [bacterium]|nr:GNAT family N-acetyltransferase [bacterium]